VEELPVCFCRAREKQMGNLGTEVDTSAVEVEEEEEDKGGVGVGIWILSVAWISTMRSEMASTESSTVIFRLLSIIVVLPPKDGAMVLSVVSFCSICISVDVISDDNG